MMFKKQILKRLATVSAVALVGIAAPVLGDEYGGPGAEAIEQLEELKVAVERNATQAMQAQREDATGVAGRPAPKMEAEQQSMNYSG